MQRGFARTATLVRLILRLDRIKLTLWLVGLCAMIAITPITLRGIIEAEAEAEGTTPEVVLAAQAAAVETSGAAIALQGPPYALDTFGGRYVFEIGAFTLALIGLMNILLVGRHTRAEEESGRTEMVRSASVGAWSSLAAVSIVALGANLVLALVTTIVFTSDGLDLGASALFGLSLGLCGLAFAATALIFVQIFEYSRPATGASIAAIGLAFAIRAIGDVRDDGLSLLSPMGWSQATNPFGEPAVWPLAILVAATLAAFGIAVALVLRRDVGAGLISQRPGPAEAGPALSSPLGLAWRLQRPTLMWWTIGLACLGATYGSVISSLDELIADNEAIIEAMEEMGMAISLDEIRNGFITFILTMVALVATGGVIQSVLRARAEENGGRAEAVLATGVSRRSWLGSHLLLAVLAAPVFMVAGGLALTLTDAAVAGTMSDLGGVVWAALTRVPALWAISGIGALLYGVAKRYSLGVWAVFALVMVIFMFGEVLQFPQWLIDLSPLTHLTSAPIDQPTWMALAAPTVIGLAAMVGGLFAFSRRDLESPA